MNVRRRPCPTRPHADTRFGPDSAGMPMTVVTILPGAEMIEAMLASGLTVAMGKS